MLLITSLVTAPSRPKLLNRRNHHAPGFKRFTWLWNDLWEGHVGGSELCQAGTLRKGLTNEVARVCLTTQLVLINVDFYAIGV